MQNNSTTQRNTTQPVHTTHSRLQHNATQHTANRNTTQRNTTSTWQNSRQIWNRRSSWLIDQKLHGKFWSKNAAGTSTEKSTSTEKYWIFAGRSKKLKGSTEVQLLTLHWSLPKLCMHFFSTVRLSLSLLVFVYVVFEEPWNKELSSVSLLHA